MCRGFLPDPDPSVVRGANGTPAMGTPVMCGAGSQGLTGAVFGSGGARATAPAPASGEQVAAYVLGPLGRVETWVAAW